ncbi:hypothetical protein BXY66_3975 [Shimia isoporae]|uniref:Uncharacterized protein n=1 Tax=Shimia isoporae TaxID=647720 RepID=A0A4V2Q1W7_9RHOB|nr:hypothetical protein [Shimia isoporae]TCK99470.1 hypothetical protein BXY66_3975 [Shimia isoporae]
MTQGTEILSRFLSKEQVAALPDQTAHRSWVFEPNLRLLHEATQNNLDLVLDDICAAWQRSYKRKRGTDEQERFMECCRVILVNLLRAHTKRRGMPVGIGSRKERLDRENRYRPDYMTTHRFRMCMEWLLNTGVMRTTAKGYHYGENAQTARFALSEKAICDLFSDELSLRDFRIDRVAEPVQLKDEQKQLTKYADTSETRGMRHALHEINTVLERTSITTPRQLTYSDFSEDYLGHTKQLYRVFNNRTFEHGGRFQGGWWQYVRKGVRRSILIDGQPTVEADYSGFNPAVLLAQAGMQVPQDPYSVIPGIENSKQLRDHAKATLAALLHAKTKHVSEPRNFDEAAHGMTVQEFRNAVIAGFPMIEDMVGEKAGMRLQRAESDLAEQVMLHFVKQGHAILPIHDAFIVQSDLEDELVTVMQEKFHDSFGQTPHITVKPSYL